MDFSIVIRTFRRLDTLTLAVRGWLATSYPAERYELVIVDDEGRGEVAEALASLHAKTHPRVRFVEGGQQGPSNANNLGASVASGRVIVFSDDDIVVAPDHLDVQRETRRVCGDSSIVTGSWRFPPDLARELARSAFGRFLLTQARDTQEREKRDHLIHVDKNCYETPVVDLKNLSVRRVDFEALGGFGSDFPNALEDSVFGIRANRAGHRLIKSFDLAVVNHETTVSLRQVAEREARVAAAYLTLARVFPEEFGQIPYLTENGPILRSDPIALKIKKKVRQLLARPASRRALIEAARFGEALRLPDRLLHAYFHRVIGLHTVYGISKPEFTDWVGFR